MRAGSLASGFAAVNSTVMGAESKYASAKVTANRRHQPSNRASAHSTCSRTS
jgi:hypothetical protein